MTVLHVQMPLRLAYRPYSATAEVGWYVQPSRRQARRENRGQIK